MSTLEAIILGIVQGLTEFLPVSSSGHIELAKVLFGVEIDTQDALLFTVVLHFATALSTVVVFRKEIEEILKGVFSIGWNAPKKFSLKIILSMFPAAFVGVFFNDAIEALFNENLLLVGLCLLFTAVILFVSERVTFKKKKRVSYASAFLIGFAQAIAILPGISRSGSTIATALLLGVEKTRAARFSFLMVIPLIFGKMAKDLLDAQGVLYSGDTSTLIIGFVTAFIVGFIACNWMLAIIKKQKLVYFALYCAVVGVISTLYAVL